MKIKKLIHHLKKHALTLLFVGGFIFDLLILPDAGHIATIWIGALYLFIVGISIALREWVIARNTASKHEQRMFSILTFAIAYFSGSALSFVCVYAIRSAAFSVSWPLFVILLLCALANELVSSHHFRFTLDVGVLLIATLFFVVFNTPLFVGVQNDTTFLIAIVITAIISLLYIKILEYLSESGEEEAPKLYALGFGIPMFIGMLYFLNVIPAVPLSLVTSGVYHHVERTSDWFVGEKERDNRFLAPIRTPVYHLSDSDNGAYFFSSVSAPAQLTAPISHVWEKYDAATNKWLPVTVIAFTLDGGRENGYRAYSQKENITEGLWRVTVKVDTKRIVGRSKFYIKKDEERKELVRINL
jgi:hypothetical protein